MYTRKIIIILLILVVSPLNNALFFGLFSSKPTRKPDAIVAETAESPSDKQAYENYLQSLATTYSSYPAMQYVPVYAVQPEYTQYVQPQQYNNYVYPAATVQSVQHSPTPVRYQYTQQAHIPSAKFQRPITVIPSVPYQETSVNIPTATQNLNKLIEAPIVSILSKAKTNQYEIPEAQMPTTLYDLPVSGIAPDFRTGGYITKTMALNPSWSSNKRSGKKFSHAYSTEDGIKVSEEGHLVHYQNGHESVVKRGQYEYIDANGKPVLVKWIADDNGYRLVN